MEYFSPIPPINMSDYTFLSAISDKKAATSSETVKKFTAIFLSEMLKQFSESTDSTEDSLFGGTNGVTINDLLVKNVAAQLAQDNVFGFEDLISKGADL